MNAVMNKCSCSLPTIPTPHSSQVIHSPTISWSRAQMLPATSQHISRAALWSPGKTVKEALYIPLQEQREALFLYRFKSQGWMQTEESYFSEPGELWSFPGCQSTAQGKKPEVQSFIYSFTHRCASSIWAPTVPAAVLCFAGHIQINKKQSLTLKNFWLRVKTNRYHPGQMALLIVTSPCTSKGCRSNSCSGKMPRLLVQFLDRACTDI